MTDNLTHQLEATKALHAAISALYIGEELLNQFLAELAGTYAMIGRDAWATAFTTDYNDVEFYIEQNRGYYPNRSLAAQHLNTALKKYMATS